MLQNQNPLIYQLAKGMTPNFNGDRQTYQMYQTLAQIVEIDSNQSNITINLSSILPNFLNVGPLSKQCYYQIQSFQFSNEFYTFSAGCSIQINTAIQVVYIDDSDQTQTDTETFSFEIEMPSDRCMPPDEICDYINKAIDKEFSTDRIIYLQEIAGGNTLYTVDTFAETYIYPLMKFKYDEKSRKMICSMDFNLEPSGVPRAPKTSYSVSSSAFQSSVQISNLQVQLLLTGYNASNLQQLQNIFGIENGREDIIFQFDGPEISYQHLINTLDSVNAKSLTQNVAAKLTMSSSQKQFIQIKSALNTARWDYRGQKTNTIESFAVNCPVGQFQSTDFQTSRIYQIRETPEGIRNFQLYITDETGQVLTFLKHYKINLAIFFDEPM